MLALSLLTLVGGTVRPIDPVQCELLGWQLRLQQCAGLRRIHTGRWDQAQNGGMRIRQ